MARVQFGVHDGGKQSPAPQVAESASKFSSNSEQIAPVTERICHRFAEGALERRLSIDFRTRREMIEAIVRREFRRLRAENAELRRELLRRAA